MKYIFGNQLIDGKVYHIVSSYYDNCDTEYGPKRKLKYSKSHNSFLDLSENRLNYKHNIATKDKYILTKDINEFI